MKIVANVDLDGVGYNFTAAIRNVCHHLYGIDRADMPDGAQWNTWESWPITRDLWFQAFRIGVLDHRIFRMGTPIDGYRQGMNELGALGIHRRIITSKIVFGDPEWSHAAMRSTLDWLDDWRVSYDSLSFTTTGESKTLQIASIAIDDHPDTGLWSRAGALNLLFDKPWNQSTTVAGVSYDDVAPGIIRAEGWEHVVELVATWIEKTERGSSD